MASLFIRKGWFYLSFFDSHQRPKQKQVALKTKDKALAKKKRKLLEAAYALGEYDPWLPPHSIAKEDLRLLSSASDAFMASRSNLTPKSVAWYQNILHLFVRHLGRSFQIEHIGVSEITSFLDSGNTGTASRHAYRRALRAFLNWLVKQNALDSNPASEVRLERLPDKHPRFLTLEDVERLCATIRDASHRSAIEGASLWLIPPISCNVFLGLRAGELVNLRWTDIDLDTRQLRVTNTLSFTTKSGKERTLPLCDPLLGLLQSIPKVGEFVFSNYGGRQIHREHLSRRFKYYARKAGLSEEINFHATRHTAASWLAQQGASIEAIRLYLGHSSTSVTEMYMHLSPDTFAAQISAAFDRVCTGTE